MKQEEYTIEKFTTSGETMGKVAGIFIKPTIYKDVLVNKVIQDFNDLMIINHLPYVLSYVDDSQKISFLRFEAERLDRALYILSCLVDYEKPEAN